MAAIGVRFRDREIPSPTLRAARAMKASMVLPAAALRDAFPPGRIDGTRREISTISENLVAVMQGAGGASSTSTDVEPDAFIDATLRRTRRSGCRPYDDDDGDAGDRVASPAAAGRFARRWWAAPSPRVRERDRRDGFAPTRERVACAENWQDG
jgi:hypothetical protein